MNDGVKMILERMKTHPEEFEGEEGKWSRTMSMYEKFFTQEEKNLLQNAILQLRRDEFTRRVMEKLLDEEQPVKAEWWQYNPQWGTSTLSIQEKALRAQSDAMRQQMENEMANMREEIYARQTKAEKNKSKMEQLLQAVTKKKQVY